LRVLRFLYSSEKNRRAFKLVFPPEIFGDFIDVGNYNKNLHDYIQCLKKLNKLPLKSLQEIDANFDEMKTYMRFGSVNDKSKVIGGYTVLDLAGKGAYGSVYSVKKGENIYAMKEISVS
jgi:hypothetical protein